MLFTHEEHDAEAIRLVRAERDAALQEVGRVKANAALLILCMEAFLYDGNVSEGGLVAQIHRFMTDQDVEYIGDRR